MSIRTTAAVLNGKAFNVSREAQARLADAERYTRQWRQIRQNLYEALKAQGLLEAFAEFAEHAEIPDEWRKGRKK